MLGTNNRKWVIRSYCQQIVEISDVYSMRQALGIRQLFGHGESGADLTDLLTMCMGEWLSRLCLRILRR